MALKFINTKGVSLSMAPFLALDTYDYSDDPNTISVTSLMKPARSIILGIQNPGVEKEVELMEMAPSAMGSAMHARLEAAWKDRDLVNDILSTYGYKHLLDKIDINPETTDPERMAIYTERRFKRKLSNGYTLTGQADLIVNGYLHDLKTCSVWSAIYDSNAEDYKLQGSLYRWLSDGLITEDVIIIEMLFTDWSKTAALKDTQSYPQTRILNKEYPLMSMEETEAYIMDKLATIEDFMDAAQSELPQCTKEELWQTDPKYKYFKSPTSKRATKVYTNSQEAYDRMNSEGCGLVKEFPGEVKRCNYCPVVDICDQAKTMEQQGLLNRI
ncbi:MAG TPA: hypothetical protein VMW20_07275 [Candidatus Nanoarchaeia archaeon]|nr:hypothetical protein [Candidatus Nanoarchaeia archaeon]